MIDIEKAKQEFINYTNNYDPEINNYRMKISHSFRVMEICRNIAEDLKLSEEYIKLATLIGLLHDIARFEQMRIYRTFSDSKSVDHGDLAVKILEENNFIRNFIETEEFDIIIKNAIKNHNKFTIEDNLDENSLLFAKIIRDADKIDIFYEAVEIFWNSDEDIYKIQNSYVSKKTLEEFFAKSPVLKKTNQTALDRVIIIIAFIFDLNFKYSRNIVIENDYINRILNKFDYKFENTKLQIEEIRKRALEELKK